ncbi:hypothetical protein C9374_009364 [Naegleria lovaniensis]|uniref:F-box domain-containing protein n=1 Tax=Naegleria lovaniensis TaxID=51637 RepID=A0AA88GJW0_NAELO|nr:uncharacterized protein C9374_009364 [Naegleria lovaniensis]KAG2377453.1 hypothetical protein C9374_009364 [Naegleria lovaniensis]
MKRNREEGSEINHQVVIDDDDEEESLQKTMIHQDENLQSSKVQKTTIMMMDSLLLADDMIFHILEYLNVHLIFKTCVRISKQWLHVAQRMPTVLDFSNSVIDLETLESVMKCSYLNNVTCLDLLGNEIGNSGIKILVRGESVLTNLTELNLKRNNIGEKGVLSC